MKSLFVIPLVLMSLVSSPSWALSIDDLVGNDADGLAYQKFTSTPFTGKLNRGLQRGSFKNGKKEGYWEEYRETGQLSRKGDYKNGEKEGYWEEYYLDDFGINRFNFGIDKLMTSKGDYKNGKKEGSWEGYWGNGQLMYKANYKNGKEEGYSEYYNQDGSLDKDRTGTYKNGVKVGD